MEPIRREAPPLPGRELAAQRWSQLTFVHWRVDSSVIAPLLPAGVRPDEHDGSSWVGLIPFRLHGASLLGGPAVPYLGDFVEVNVRLYAVDETGRRGVVFRSLEASRLPAVLAARAAFGLPYVWARTALRHDSSRIRYRSRRIGDHGIRSHVSAEIGDPVQPTTLSDFLTARWGMFTRRRLGGRARTVFARNAHEPWELRDARVTELDETLTAAAGSPGLAGRAPDSVLYARGVTARFAGQLSPVD